MINIRDFNDLIILNVYFVSLQFEIISRLLKCTHIIVINVIYFFYQ